MDIPKLIKEAQLGYDAAQKCLYDIYLGRLYSVCRSYVKNEQDAEECCSDGYYKIFIGLQSFEFKGEAAFYQWMKRTMINQCLMFSRYKTSINIVVEAEAENLPFPEEAFNKMATDDICRMLDHLPLGCRAIFNLFVLEGYSHGEIAEMVGISEGTSRAHLANARKLLQKLITERENYGRNEQSKQ